MQLIVELHSLCIFRGKQTFWDKCSEIEEITIPYYNLCKSIRDSWFVSSPTLVPIKKNVKLFTPLYRGDS